MAFIDIFLDFILNPWFLVSLIFWIFVLLLVFLLRNKKGAVYLWFPFLAMFRTKKLNNFIKRISKKAPKFWKIFWTIGIFVSFCFIIFALYFFFTNIFGLIFRPSPTQAFIPLIPGVTISLPVFSYLILPLLFIVTTHELAHGISANNDDVDVKSTGLLGAGLFFIIGFGAFVEVDERALRSNKYHRNTRLRIAAAGTYVNGITVGIAFILIQIFPLLISPFYYQAPQINYVFREEEGGFNYGNLTIGDVILAVKKQGSLDEEYVSLDENAGRTLTNILNNRTIVQCSVGDNLTFRVYNPSSDTTLEKNITLGPRYNIGIEYRYISNNTELEITRIYSQNEGGINYDKNLTVGLHINRINVIPINVTNGDSLEKTLTSFNLNAINFSSNTETWILDLEVEGVRIGTYSSSYFMHKNDVAKFLTNYWPDFWLREIIWLFLIAFSITLFNMLPLPVFDGDRMVKELINWGIGEGKKTLRKKTDKIPYNKEENSLNLSEYQVENVEMVKVIIEDKTNTREQSEIIIAEDKYILVDKIGDGFKDSISLNLPEQTKLEEDSVFEITYEYWYDEKRKLKKNILNSIRLITFFIVLANFILSFIRFGAIFFWL